MSGLILKLGPNERVLINGAVIENGDRRSRLSVKTPNAHILRLRDALHPDEARTPVTRCCLDAQLMLTGDLDPAEGRRRLLAAIERLSRAFDDADSRRILDIAGNAALEGNAYQVLRAMKQLISREARLLGMAGG